MNCNDMYVKFCRSGLKGPKLENDWDRDIRMPLEPGTGTSTKIDENITVSQRRRLVQLVRKHHALDRGRRLEFGPVGPATASFCFR